jgi:hypothetical protein
MFDLSLSSRGLFCEIDFDDCVPNPCRNGGTCVANVTTSSQLVVCNCTDGFDGEKCEKRVDPCDVNPCLNGAKCESTRDEENFTAKLKCNCSTGFGGNRCQKGEGV